jgi:hypoxanthine phosphoribosyltransferase
VIQKPKRIYSPVQLAARVARMGRLISRDYAGHTLDVVVVLETAFIFGADLVRRISCPVVCHFVRAETREIRLSGYHRREIFFSRHPELKNRHVLLVSAVLQSGITHDFLLRRLLEGRPRSLRLAVLIDKPEDRRVNLQPDYFGLVAASKYMVGYGLTERHGRYRNLPYLGVLPGARRGAGRPGRRVR